MKQSWDYGWLDESDPRDKSQSQPTGQGKDTLMLFHWHIYEDDCLMKTSKRYQIKGPGKMAIITSAINAEVYTQILGPFSSETRFGDDNKVVYQVDSASCKSLKKL